MKKTLIILSVVLICYSIVITHKYIKLQELYKANKTFAELIIEGKLKSIHFFNGVSYKQNKRLK